MSQINNLCIEFLKNQNEKTALNLLSLINLSGNFDLGLIIGEFLISIYNHCYEIKREYSVSCYFTKNYEKFYSICENILLMKNLDENLYNFTIFNQHFAINHICDRYIDYKPEIIDNILNRKAKEFPLVTLTITTCKRFDLFEKTINSFLQCVDIEMIDNWFLIDDNSTEEDREKMKRLYPFFTFYFKNYNEKGHVKSMNIIKEQILNKYKTPYMLHIEDDWKFFVKKNFIKDAIDVLGDNENLGQCLFNKNYTEIESDISIRGGDFKKTLNGTRYYIHEYANTPEKIEQWIKKHGSSTSSNYWPHFSFRPSLIKTKIFKDIQGDFSYESNHFEMDYAYRYTNKGYSSSFFEALYCIHIGRLTCQKHDESIVNAYKLNNEEQFVKKEKKKIKSYVINLDRRADRYEKFNQNGKNNIEFLNCERFSAIDGKILKSTTQIQRIFNNNDYDMKLGMVGCALSHIKLYIELIYSDYDAFCIFEDDISFAKDFQKKIMNIFDQVKDKDFDIIYLGHHLRNLNEQEKMIDKNEEFSKVEKWDVFKSFDKSIGGNFAYLISKNGAKNILNYINEIGGLRNCIDTIIQKSANKLNILYCNPNIVFSNCYRNEGTNIDSDIQYTHESLTISLVEKTKQEIEFYNSKNLKIEKLNFEDSFEKIKNENDFIIYCLDPKIDNIGILKNKCIEKNIKFYIIENIVIFIYNKIEDINRYFHYFKINDRYSIEDCL